MIILIDGFGGYSNRLFQNAKFEAYCIENRRRFVNLSFDDVKKCYGLKASPLTPFFKLVARILAKLKIIRVLRFYDEVTSSVLTTELSQQKVSFVDGWFFNCPDLLDKHRDYFMNRYSLPEHSRQSNAFIQHALAKRANEIIVGVHVRRGDYRTWYDGKYYFENEVFKNYILNMDKQLKEIGKLGRYIVFTNEAFFPKDLPCVIISNEPWYIDHYLMTKCDFLMGPPSTFTGWASFIGQTPLLYMDGVNSRFSLSDFFVR